MLIGAVVTELVLLLFFLFVPLIAGVLGQKPPPDEAWVVAALAVPAVLLADALYKKILALRRSGR